MKYFCTYSRRICCDFGSFVELSALKQLLVLFYIEIICTRQIRTTCKLECKIGVVQSGQNVRNDGLFVDIDTKNLAFLIYTDDTVGRVVVCGDKNSLPRNTVHVDTGTGFEVIEVDEAIFSDKVNDAMLL